MAELRTPQEILKRNPELSKRFPTPQQVGYFLKIFTDKIEHAKYSRVVLINETQFVSFIKYLDSYAAIV